MTTVAFTLAGQPYSKANRRQLVPPSRHDDGAHARLIKSPEALRYERDALMQIPPHCRVRFAEPVCVTLHLYYASERADLDESLLLDVLQDRWKAVTIGHVKTRVLIQAGVYRNDRQVREKHVFHHIDQRHPRAEIRVEPLGSPSGVQPERQGENREPEAT
ncbi:MULTISPECIES: hypothetical protein [Burkholderia cepacia complex]|uniref:hypothetical protein n=1 Tax=Burkholderia cepacia complex TaxID=87882 RepID=UPI0007C7EEED|nr:MULTISPECIES: hypothetical protein [Burkholderia cepacia complex]